MRGIWLFAKAGVFVIGLLVIAGIVAALIFAPWEPQFDDLPPSAVLDLEIVGDLPEKPSNADFAQFVRGDSMTVSRLVRVLDRAAADSRITGLDMDLSLADLRLTDVEALLPAIAAFKASGKPTRVFAESYDLARYRLASGFDEIWISPSGEFAVTGVALEMPFAGELVDRLGIKPALEQRKDFKTAADVLKRRSMESHVRVAFAELVQDIHRSALNDIAEGRGLTFAQVQAALETALLNPEAALQNGLLDRAAYATAFHDAAGKPKVGFAGYLPELQDPLDGSAPTIALIVASGQISGGKGSGFGSNVITDGALIEELRAADEHSQVDAILLRIDSPGGAYGASGAIRAAMADIDKPIVASMSAVAGSGGYMIALGADAIVAHPSTITGSIGVISGKIVVDELLDDYGVRFEIIRSERNAAIFSPFADFTSDQQARLSRRVDAIYDAFTGMVADARKLPPEQVEAAAQGRVWTGSQAFGLKLVDATGGFGTAFDLLRQRLGVAAGRELHVAEFPGGSAQDRFLEVIQDGFAGARAAMHGPEVSIDSMRDHLAAEAGIQLMAPDLTLR
ncbi:MAG: signal peptide peptidase SppA [Minwuia sp.]|nr:signal peptide peptidase SppA [Minwuia sp.]